MCIRKVINTINRKMDKRMMGALGGIRIPAPERDSTRKEITAPMAEMGVSCYIFLRMGEVSKNKLPTRLSDSKEGGREGVGASVSP